MVQEAAPQLTSQTRLWLQPNGAGPANAPEYQGRARVTDTGVSTGSLTAIRAPSPVQYGKFINVGVLRGVPDLPSVSFEARQNPDTLSQMLELINRECEFDAQVHMGLCENPQDFAGGWTIARIFEQLTPSTYGGGDLGTFDEGGNAPITDTLEAAAQRIYEVKRLRAGAVAAAEITDEVVDATICDAITCGECGRVSNGCQIAFLLVAESSGSPGLGAKVIYTEDGGLTWGTSAITSLGVGEAARRMACVGTNLVVVAPGSTSLHYAAINDILDGVAVWAEVTTGFTNAPRAITSAAFDRTWIASVGGIIYLASDPTSAVTVQADGSASAQDLNDIHAFDRDNVVAVGASNAVLVSANGGDTWALVVGPAVGVALNTVWMRSAQEWLVGTAGGELYYTANAGATWVEKGFAGSGAGSVESVRFASRHVGYMSHTAAGPVGRVFRTIDGGYSWKLLPEQVGLSAPTHDRTNALAACPDDVNFLIAGGLGANGSDGVAIKFA